MSDRFELVKEYYDKKRWGIRKVHAAVGRWITTEEYELITGELYE